MRLLHGDCRELLKQLPDASVDSIVTDPPYELGFMGKKWDASGIAYDGRVWAECLRVLKPGGHLLAFGGTRTYHRMACAIEDAGFEIRDCIMWVYGSGFPKSHDVSKAIDRAAGAEREILNTIARPNLKKRFGDIDGRDPETFRKWIAKGRAITAPTTDVARQWQGWGSALKPAVEPIVVARKPLEGTIAENVLQHGTGAINVDGCRVACSDKSKFPAGVISNTGQVFGGGKGLSASRARTDDANQYGRWPANFIHDGSEEVVGLFPETNASKAAPRGGTNPNPMDWGKTRTDGNICKGHNDSGGSAARFFYCAKASSSEREDNRHPTVKPISLMRYLCRLVTPPKGTVLDPFAGSGTTLVAARAEGFEAIGCELMADHIDIIRQRLDMPLEAEPVQDKVETTNTKNSKPVQLKLLL